MDTPNHAAVAAKSTIDGLRPCINFQTTPAKHIKPRQPIAAPYGSRAAAWRPRIVLWIPAFCFFAFSCFSTSVALAGNMAGPQGSLKTGQSGSLQNRTTVKARDIDVDRGPYRLCRHEQCFERRKETTSHRTGKARMVFTKDRARNRCSK